MATKRPSPPDLLIAKQPVMIKLAKELKVSRWHTYGLIRPTEYPDAIPADLFDTRSDLADRIATFIDTSKDGLRDYYARAKTAA